MLSIPDSPYFTGVVVFDWGIEDHLTMTSICRWFQRKRITCLLGTGATIPVGGPKTAEITDAARQKSQHVIDPSTGQWIDVRFIDEIAERLNHFLAPHRCHFEDIFHVLEGLESYRAGWQTGTHERYKPRLAPFVTPVEGRWFDLMWLIAAKTSLLEAVAEQVEESLNRFEPNGAHQWFRSFWMRALKAAVWDVGTLNYDNLLEQVHPGFEDGFPTTPKGARFDPHRLWASRESNILHLHGSIFYGYLPTSEQKGFVDYHDDLCKYRSSAEARQTWFGRSNPTAQSHDEAVIGPLITGLRKTDKLTVHPYDEYQAVFRRAVRKSPRLLIAGYSFGDLYLNSIVDRMLALHGTSRRVVIVTWFPGGKDNWHCDPHVLQQHYEWPGMEMHYSLGTAMDSPEPLGRSLTYNDRLTSDDGCCRVYFGGTQEAFEKYGVEILEFLMRD